MELDQIKKLIEEILQNSDLEQEEREGFKNIILHYILLLNRKSFQTTVLTSSAFLHAGLGLLSTIKTRYKSRYFYLGNLALTLLFVSVYPYSYGLERELEKLRIESQKQPPPVNLIK
ncbi:MAG: hypothetical protein QXM92_02740 [Candidatus Anstonellales archaeon]